MYLTNDGSGLTREEADTLRLPADWDAKWDAFFGRTAPRREPEETEEDADEYAAWLNDHAGENDRLRHDDGNTGSRYFSAWEG